jgi:hypothetical protein
MRIVYADGTTELVDFVIPTVEEARALIADGAVNAQELLEDAGISPAAAAAEVERLRAEAECDPLSGPQSPPAECEGRRTATALPSGSVVRIANTPPVSSVLWGIPCFDSRLRIAAKSASPT